MYEPLQAIDVSALAVFSHLTMLNKDGTEVKQLFAGCIAEVEFLDTRSARNSTDYT